MRVKDTEGHLVTNTWRVIQYEPPRRAVTEQKVIHQGKNGPFAVDITETNTYRKRLGGCSLKRVSRYSFSRDSRNPYSVERWRAQLRAEEKATLRALKEALLASGSSQELPQRDHRPGPVLGPYLNDGLDDGREPSGQDRA